MHAIVLLPIIPLRINDSESSEMVSQLLYGEIVEILQTKNRWTKICNLADNYQGWVDTKMLTHLSPQEFKSLILKPEFRLNPPFQLIKNSKQQMLVLAGASIIRDENSIFHNFVSFKIDKTQIYDNVVKTGAKVVENALCYLNAPYLWGGKTVFGIDCSGLVQLVFNCCGYQLPRDASQQIACGTIINSLADTLPGDVVFFKNENEKIHHVGILINQNELIHASGWVKCESIDANGIISSVTGEYTHQLAAIRRIF